MSSLLKYKSIAGRQAVLDLVSAGGADIELLDRCLYEYLKPYLRPHSSSEERYLLTAPWHDTSLRVLTFNNVS